MEEQNVDKRIGPFANYVVLRQGMDRAGLDVLVATSPESVFYLSGSDTASYINTRGRLMLVVVPLVGTETLLISSIMGPLSRATSWIEDIRTYPYFVQSPIELLAEVLKEKGLHNKRIGIEMKFCTVAFHQEMLQRLEEAVFLPADPILDRARAIKTPAEIERLRSAALLTDQAVDAAWKRSHPGDTEKDVAQRMVEEFAKNGAERVNHIVLHAGKNLVINGHSPGDKKLEAGEIVESDYGAIYQRFWSDLARMGVVKRSSQRQRDLYSKYLEVYRAIIGRMKPGVESRDLFNFAKKEYTRRGIDFTWAAHIGHSMGIAPGQEEPMLHPFVKTPLEPNMLFAVEPMFMTYDVPEYYHLEDLVLITDGDPQILTNRWKAEELFVFE